MTALSPIVPSSATCCPASAPETFACPTDTEFAGSACESSYITYAAKPFACGYQIDRTASCTDFTGWTGDLPVSESDGSCGSKKFNYIGEGILCCRDPAHTGN